MVSAADFVHRTFDVKALPVGSRVRDFLRTAHDLCGLNLLPALAEKCSKEFQFVPRVLLHEGTLQFSATSYCFIARLSMREVRAKAMRGTLTQEDCTPLLMAVEVKLLTAFGLDARLVKRVAR